MFTEFCPENLTGRDRVDDQGLNGRIILNWVLKILCAGVDWMHLVQSM